MAYYARESAPINLYKNLMMKAKLKNLILLILFWNVNILAAENDARSSISAPDRNLSVYSEKVLISAVDNIKKKAGLKPKCPFHEMKTDKAIIFYPRYKYDKQNDLVYED